MKSIMQGGKPDGRECDFCGCKDTDPDPVDKVLVVVISDDICVMMSWGYLPDSRGNQSGSFFFSPTASAPQPTHLKGNSCLYCYLVYCSKYKIRNISKTKAIADIGSSKAEYDRRSFLQE